MEDMVDQFFLKILGTLNEAQARWYVGREAIALGRGGATAMRKLTGMSRSTIRRGMLELRDDKLPPAGRVRGTGGGRKKLEFHDEGLAAALEEILRENTAGDPMSLLRWTTKSTRTIAEELTRRKHPVSADTVGRRILDMGYSLQGNVKVLEQQSDPDRDRQFRYINRQAKTFLAQGWPVISVDTKKKEKVGNFKNPGQIWHPKGQPERVNTYDFPHLAVGTAIPYGAYDLLRNAGFVNVGVSHDTAEFAVESIRRWWRLDGSRHYPSAPALLICADGGGSNGSRVRAWKYHLQSFADEFGIAVTVLHYPPGTSKWNKIEHRLFSHISMNWKGKPLVSYATVVNLIRGTRTRSGLQVTAKLDERAYPVGKKITKEQMESVSLRRHKTHPKWNYTIEPQ